MEPCKQLTERTMSVVGVSLRLLQAVALSDAFVRRLSVCLSVALLAYIGPNSRTERPMTEIGTEVAHVTRDSDTTSKVKRSKVKVTRPLWLAVQVTT